MARGYMGKTENFTRKLKLNRDRNKTQQSCVFSDQIIQEGGEGQLIF
jgi:hypothetical protein